jgi:hypothetical protein
MEKRKNEARLYYKGEQFIIYQDGFDNWRFTYGILVDVNTMHKELQPALNEIYQTIEERRPKTDKPKWVKKDRRFNHARSNRQRSSQAAARHR